MTRTPLLGVVAVASLALLTTACSSAFDVLPISGSASTPEASTATAAAGAPQPKITTTAVGWGAHADAAWATGVLKNTGTAAGATTVSFTAFGRDGSVLALSESPAVQVRVGETTAVGAVLEIPEGSRIARVATDIATAPLTSPSAARTTLAGVNVQRGGSRLLGTVTTTEAANIALTAVCRDGSDVILGGGTADLGSVNAGGATTFQIDGMVVSAEPEACEVYTNLTA